MISIKNRFVFIHIPKTAGTSIEKCLEDASCICMRNEKDYKNRGFSAPLNHLTLTQISDGEFLPNSDLKGYFKFTFVRNPWSRVISECFCPHIQLIFKDCKDIAERIRRVCELSAEGYGGHCLQQTDFVRSETVSLDFIGRYEKLADDMEFVLRKTGCQDRSFRLVRNTRVKHYRDFYDASTRKLVEQKYAEEIEEFQYIF